MYNNNNNLPSRIGQHKINPENGLRKERPYHYAA